MVIKEKRFWGFLFLTSLLLASGCGDAQETVLKEENEMVLEEENEFLYITEMDLTTEYTEPIDMNLSDMGENLTIEKGGEYVLTGSYYQTLKIDAHDEIVHLYFNTINIETAIGPAIEVVSAGKVIITLMEDSSNTLFDAAYYSDEKLSGAISSNCDLTINGPGSLYVCGYYKDAIHTKDVFKVLGGTVQLKAKRNGIKANDGILLSPEYLVIESEKNGCQTSNANKEGKGIIDIHGGEISIVAGQYGLSAVSDVYIRDGEIYLNSVIGDIQTEGQQYIAEGTCIDE